jgi:hypothetical protein
MEKESSARRGLSFKFRLVSVTCNRALAYSKIRYLPYSSCSEMLARIESSDV